MKLLGLDVEGSSKLTGAMDPSKEGFYLSCCGLLLVDTEDLSKNEETIVWFHHSEQLPTPDGAGIIQSYIDRSDIVIGHNLKYDFKGLMYYGVNCNYVKIWDTLIGEYILSGQNVLGQSFKLDDLAKYYKVVGKKSADKVKALWDAGVDTKDIPASILSEYQLQDCRIPINLYLMQRKQAEAEGMVKVLDLQMEWLQCVIEMEYSGIGFNLERAKEIQAEYKTKADELEKFFVNFSGVEDFNINSNQQRSALIYGGSVIMQREVWEIKTFKHHSTYKPYLRRVPVPIKSLGFPQPTNIKKIRGVPNDMYVTKDNIRSLINEKGAYWAVDKNTVADLPAFNKTLKKYKQMLLDYAKYTKIHETLEGTSGRDTGLIPKMTKDRCIHPSLNMTISKTGRLTSSSPNGQNLFSTIKECFVPKNDFIAQHDMSQVEWRAAADLAQDKVMLHEINSGVDQHIATCIKLMGLPFISKEDPASSANRKAAKVFNFRMIFGGTKWGFVLDINMPDFGAKRYQEIIDGFWEKYNGLFKFHQNNIQTVQDGFTLRTPLGRKFSFAKIVQLEDEWTYKENQIKNYPIQGSCADLLALFGVIVRRGMRKQKMKSKMILTVHDSIVFDVVAKEAEALKNLCYGVSNSLREYIKAYFQIPWTAYMEGEFEIGTNYKDLHFVGPDQKVMEVLNYV